MKETAILYSNRPWAISPAEDIGLERHGNLVDEAVAIKLGFPLHNLQYVPLSLLPNDKKKRTRVTGTIRITVQTIMRGKPGNSLSLNARVVRDLFDLTGAEATADSKFSKKLAEVSSKKKEERSWNTNPITKGIDADNENLEGKSYSNNVVDSSKDDLSDYSDASSCSFCEDLSCSNDSCTEETEFKAAHVHRVSCAFHGLGQTRIRRVQGSSKISKELAVNSSKRKEERSRDTNPITKHVNDSDKELSDCSDTSSCSFCEDYSCSGHSNTDSEDDKVAHVHRVYCVMHGTEETRVRRVRGRNKFLAEVRARITDEDHQKLQVELEKNKKTSEEVLDDLFPGGAQKAHHLLNLWEKKDETPLSDMKNSEEKGLPTEIRVIKVNGVLTAQETYSDGEVRCRNPGIDPPVSPEREPDFCSRTACYCHTGRGMKLCRTRFLSSSSSSSSEPDYCSPTACYCHTPRGKKLCRTRFKNC